MINSELNEELLNKEKKIYKYYKCMMLSNFLCYLIFYVVGYSLED